MHEIVNQQSRPNSVAWKVTEKREERRHRRGKEQRRPANNHALISGVIMGDVEAKAAKICCNRGENGGK